MTNKEYFYETEKIFNEKLNDLGINIDNLDNIEINKNDYIFFERSYSYALTELFTVDLLNRYYKDNKKTLEYFNNTLNLDYAKELSRFDLLAIKNQLTQKLNKLKNESFLLLDIHKFLTEKFDFDFDFIFFKLMFEIVNIDLLNIDDTVKNIYLNSFSYYKKQDIIFQSGKIIEFAYLTVPQKFYDNIKIIFVFDNPFFNFYRISFKLLKMKDIYKKHLENIFSFIHYQYQILNLIKNKFNINVYTVSSSIFFENYFKNKIENQLLRNLINNRLKSGNASYNTIFKNPESFFDLFKSIDCDCNLDTKKASNLFSYLF